ncbi:hypothetical protein FB451DRAFT_69259 [Mycena latifolia]|nr:hypothetical protein FB451DRAFT_69259 [Mycena latifolia]
MLPTASIAFIFLISLSGIAVHSAPLHVARDEQPIAVRPQACTGPNGTGTCFPLLSTGTTGPGSDEGECNNVGGIGIKSLKFTDDQDECFGFQNPGCEFIPNNGSVVREFFSGNSDDLPDDIQSLSCI